LPDGEKSFSDGEKWLSDGEKSLADRGKWLSDGEKSLVGYGNRFLGLVKAKSRDFPALL
jgi:hypothetical protein